MSLFTFLLDATTFNVFSSNDTSINNKPFGKFHLKKLRNFYLVNVELMVELLHWI